MTINHTLYLRFSGFDILLKPHPTNQKFVKGLGVRGKSPLTLSNLLITNWLVIKHPSPLTNLRFGRGALPPRPNLIKSTIYSNNLLLTNGLQIVDLSGGIAARSRFVSRQRFVLLCNFLLRHTTSIYKRNSKQLAVGYKGCNLLVKNCWLGGEAPSNKSSICRARGLSPLATNRRFVVRGLGGKPPHPLTLDNFLLTNCSEGATNERFVGEGATNLRFDEGVAKQPPNPNPNPNQIEDLSEGASPPRQENNLSFSSDNISNKFKFQQFVLPKKPKCQKQNPQNKNCFNILKTINNFLNDKNLLEPNSLILLSISGGQDSICLFFLFEILKIQWNWKISIIYCNHLWQKDSFETQNQICKTGYYFTDNIYFTAIPGQTNDWRIVSINPNSLSIPFGTYFLKLPNHQKLIFFREIAANKSSLCMRARGLCPLATNLRFVVRGLGGKPPNPLTTNKLTLKNIFLGNCSDKSKICSQLTRFTEQKARNWRYQLWQKLSIFYKYTFLITGHTATDRAETLLLNLIRGSGKRGVTSLQWNKKVLKMFSCFFPKKQENIFKTKFLGYKKKFNVKHSYRFVLMVRVRARGRSPLATNLRFVVRNFLLLALTRISYQKIVARGRSPLALTLRNLQFYLFMYLIFLNYKKNKLQENTFSGQKIHLPAIAYPQIGVIRTKLATNFRFVGKKYAKFLFFNLCVEFVAKSVHKKIVDNFIYRNSYFQILRQLFRGRASLLARKIYFLVPKKNIIKNFRFVSKILFWLGDEGASPPNQIEDLLTPLANQRFDEVRVRGQSPLTTICYQQIGTTNRRFDSSNRNCNHNKCEKDLSNLKQKYVTLIKINLYKINQKQKINQQLKFTYIYKKFISSP